MARKPKSESEAATAAAPEFQSAPAAPAEPVPEAVAETVIAQHARAGAARSKLAGKVGLDLLRALFLLNGLAAIALLTYLGGDHGSVEAAGAFKPAVRDFAIGVLWAVGAAMAAYICQGQYAMGEDAEVRAEAGQTPTQGAPYSDRRRLHMSIGHGAQALAVVLALVSVFSFWTGMNRGLAVDFASLPHGDSNPVRVVVESPPAVAPVSQRAAVHCSGRQGGIVMHMGGDRSVMPTCNGRPIRRTGA